MSHNVLSVWDAQSSQPPLHWNTAYCPAGISEFVFRPQKSMHAHGYCHASSQLQMQADEFILHMMAVNTDCCHVPEAPNSMVPSEGRWLGLEYRLAYVHFNVSFTYCGPSEWIYCWCQPSCLWLQDTSTILLLAPRSNFESCACLRGFVLFEQICEWGDGNQTQDLAMRQLCCTIMFLNLLKYNLHT